MAGGRRIRDHGRAPDRAMRATDQLSWRSLRRRAGAGRARLLRRAGRRLPPRILHPSGDRLRPRPGTGAAGREQLRRGQLTADAENPDGDG